MEKKTEERETGSGFPGRPLLALPALGGDLGEDSPSLPSLVTGIHRTRESQGLTGWTADLSTQRLQGMQAAGRLYPEGPPEPLGPWHRSFLHPPGLTQGLLHTWAALGSVWPSVIPCEIPTAFGNGQSPVRYPVCG